MGYVIGALAGVVCGVGCIVVVGGAIGVVCGLAVAALLYLGIGALLKPERKLGGVAASLVPDGEAAAARIDEARALIGRIAERRAQMRDAEVARETDDLMHDIETLVALVEGQPASHRRLAHFLTTYADQCVRMLDGYLALEHLAPPELVRQGHEDTVEALCALQGVAQGELARATGRKASDLEASSAAIQRLMEMDGYQPDERAGGADQGTPSSQGPAAAREGEGR